VRDKKLIASILLLLVLGLFTALFVTACGEEETTTTAAPTTAAPTTAAPTTATTAGATTTVGAEQGEDLVIGAINSMTGSNVLTGQEEKWAQEKAVADINAKGGLKLNDGKMHKVVLKYADDKSSPQEGAAAMERLIKTEGLKVILSSNITPINQAAATVAEQYGVFFQIVSSWIDQPFPDGTGPSFIGGMKLKWSADMFEAAVESGKVAVGGAKAMDPADVPTKWAVMVENTPDGIGFGDATAMGLEAEGWEVVSYEKFVEGQKDFSSIILKFKDAGVEAVVTLIAPADGITFVNQMKEAGWAPKYLFGYKGFWPVDFYSSLGSDADYICYDGFWSETLPFPYAKELGAAFSAEHDGATSNSIGLYYAGVQILATAIERAGVFEPGAIRDQIFGGTFEGTTMGDITYGAYYPDNPGIAHIPFLAFQWAPGGERVVLYPTEYATGKTVTFVPWDQR
jgi:branched-chain amino acid transport system substrate-binding protein